MKVSIKQLINRILVGLSDRQKDILESRYGLINPQTLTLQSIGERYGITREGIRRIEAQALEIVAKNAAAADFRDFIKLVSDHLRRLGGVRKEDDLANDVKLLIQDSGSANLLPNHLKFLLEVSQSVFYHTEDKGFYGHWYLTKDIRQKAVKFINLMEKALKAGAEVDANLRTLNAANYLSISKKFAVNSYGDFGLRESKEIMPKSARDWAYLVLKRESRPIHYSELALLVNKFSKKQSHPQTIHNELIKDDNFVLIGKGTYGLKEHGYLPGTAREVIVRLLKKNGPLKSQEVVKLVLQERFFKENTVLINLQNKEQFKRLEDGRYTTLA